ncbi:MAG: hypothetical protein E4G95_05520 [Bacteroidia bacterium]|nr:MAG: hypothetical protein E4G95_05520 [Bacteroidia bacterium]
MPLNRTNIFILIIIAASLSGCFEKEDMIIPREINEIEIPYSLYEYQTYYRFGDETIVSFNGYDQWDLGFECRDEGFSVILNSSRYMHAGEAGTTDFSSVVSSEADTMIFDDSSGDLSRTALGGWVDLSDPLNPVFTGSVFIIDRGLNESGESFGYVKLVIEKLEAGIFYIRYANLDGSGENTFMVAKDPLVNFALFSFDNGGKLSVQQPVTTGWDLCFTKYSTVIPDNSGVPTPYIVRGVFINNMAGVTAVLDSATTYYDINLSSLPDYVFSSKQDAIGYEWKVYQDESYTLVDRMNYVICDRSGRYFKIRFTDYFNKAGQRGYPAFEQIELLE